MSIKVNGIEVNPTIFPDKTSQVWKIDEEIFNGKEYNIEFNFKDEGEIFHLQQLNNLLKFGRVPRPMTLHMPYLPYGRQDKEISNETTFALNTFADIINRMFFKKVTTLDAHSKVAEKLFDNFENIYPGHKIITAHHSISDFEEGAYNTVMAYPDAGAAERYGSKGGRHIIGDKVRDQLTGYITEYKIEGNPEGKDILIVDDICDGGMTFRLMAKELYKQGAQSVHLYVTHGIFSKGLKVLQDAGIQRIFTKDGEVFPSKDTNYLYKPSKDLLESELSNI